MSDDPFAYFTKRQAILKQNELLREPRFAKVREALWRCCVCARRQCRDAPRCRETLEDWAKGEWDAAVERAVFARTKS